MSDVMVESEPRRIMPADPVSVRQVARSWLDRKTPDGAASTLRTYRRCVDNICDRLGNTLIDDPTVSSVDEFERELLAHGSAAGEALSAKSVHGVHAVLHQILAITTWSIDEVKTFLCTVRDHRLHAVFVVLLTTGLTRGELVGSRWRDIDLDAGTLTVRRIVSMAGGTPTETAPTTAAQRTIEIGPRTIEVLGDHRRASEATDDMAPVFEKRGGGELNPESLSSTFARLVEQAGVSQIAINGLRTRTLRWR